MLSRPRRTTLLRPTSSTTAPSSTPRSRPSKCICRSTGVADDNLRHPTREPLVIRRVPERPLEARRGNFQRIRRVDGVLDVEDGAQILADALTILDPDALFRALDDDAALRIAHQRAVNDDAQHQPYRFPPQPHVEDVELTRPRHAFGRVPYALQPRIVDHAGQPTHALPGNRRPKQKKWALAHSNTDPERATS